MTTTYNASTSQTNADLLQHLADLTGLIVITDRAKFPLYTQQYDELKGICIGGCIIGGGNIRHNKKPWTTKNELAHAHGNFGGHKKWERYCGWICVRKQYLLSKMLMLHEIAHLKRTNPRHDDSFRKVLLGIGGTLDATKFFGSYHKISRKKKQ